MTMLVRRVSPSLPPKVGEWIYDHFDSIPDVTDAYEFDGGVFTVANSNAYVAAGQPDGTRRLRHKKNMLTDDYLLRFTTGSALTARFSSLVTRANGFGGAERFVALHFVNGNMYLQRTHKDTGALADFAAAGSLTTTQLPVGGYVELISIGQRFVVAVCTAAGIRVSKIDFTDSSQIAAKGPDYRNVGLRFERYSNVNSPYADLFEAYDLTRVPIPMGKYKSGTQTIATAQWTRITGWAVLSGYQLTEQVSATGAMTSRGAGDANVNIRVQVSASRTVTLRIVNAVTGAVWATGPTTTSTVHSFTSKLNGWTDGDQWAVEVFMTASGTISAGSAASKNTGTSVEQMFTTPLVA